MTRITPGNVFKIVLAVCFFYLLAFLVLIIGVGAKDRKLIIEGAVYAAMFSIAMALPTESGLAAVLGLVSMGASIIRGYQLRDLWLPRRGTVTQPLGQSAAQPVSPPQAPQAMPVMQASPAAAVPTHRSGIDDLASALAWITSHAKQNKHRLPSADYVTILETCHTLDAVIDAQRAQPVQDARFEYELEAMVREYLPTVLQSYLAVPPSMVDDPQPNGRTPGQELTEQLGLLSGQADALHASRHRQMSSDLTSNGNFLRERFGHHQPGGFDFGIE